MVFIITKLGNNLQFTLPKPGYSYPSPLPSINHTYYFVIITIPASIECNSFHAFN